MICQPPPNGKDGQTVRETYQSVMVSAEQQVIKDTKDTKVIKVIKDTMDSKETKDSKGIRVAQHVKN